MAPEKSWLEYSFPFEDGIFSGAMLNFQGVIQWPHTSYKLRPAATRNAQRCVPNADPQRKGPKWVSSSADGVDAFSSGRKKHPKEPYVLKGHVTSSHGPYWSTDWHGLDASPWGWQCETRHPLCATQSSDVVILTARAQMIFFMSVPLGSDATCPSEQFVPLLSNKNKSVLYEWHVNFQQSNQQLAPQSKPCRKYLITFKHIFKSSTAFIRKFSKLRWPKCTSRFHPTTEFALLASNTWLWSVVVHCFKDWLNSSIFFASRWWNCGNEADSNTKFKVELGIQIIETSNHYIL